MSGRITTGEPLAKFYQQDAKYLETRIGELHTHAIIHDGELCSKLNRARIGGMIEVLSRIGLEVECSWDRCDRNVLIVTEADFVENKRHLKGREQDV